MIYPYIPTKDNEGRKYLVLPARTLWFNINTVHEIEKKALPEWFKIKKGIMATMVWMKWFRATSSSRNMKSCTRNTGIILLSWARESTSLLRNQEKDWRVMLALSFGFISLSKNGDLSTTSIKNNASTWQSRHWQVSLKQTPNHPKEKIASTGTS